MIFSLQAHPHVLHFLLQIHIAYMYSSYGKQITNCVFTFCGKMSLIAWICPMQFANLCNFKIVLCKLEIANQLWNGNPILKLCSAISKFSIDEGQMECIDDGQMECIDDEWRRHELWLSGTAFWSILQRMQCQSKWPKWTKWSQKIRDRRSCNWSTVTPWQWTIAHSSSSGW